MACLCIILVQTHTNYLFSWFVWVGIILNLNCQFILVSSRDSYPPFFLLGTKECALGLHFITKLRIESLFIGEDMIKWLTFDIFKSHIIHQVKVLQIWYQTINSIIFPYVFWSKILVGCPINITSVACVIHPIVTTSLTDFSSQTWFFGIYLNFQ